jgi:hypothetical protein
MPQRCDACRSAPRDDRHLQGTRSCPARRHAHHREPHLAIPLRLACYANDPPPPATQVEATRRRGIASISAQHWGRWIAASSRRDGGGLAPHPPLRRVHLDAPFRERCPKVHQDAPYALHALNGAQIQPHPNSPTSENAPSCPFGLLALGNQAVDMHADMRRLRRRVGQTNRAIERLARLALPVELQQ